jgi:3-oxocholest-4-en-26-oate---CoA ligase
MRPHYHFADLFELAVDKVPDRIAIVDVGRGGGPEDADRRVTYAELEARANKLAHALLASGVQPGDHVGIYAMNCVEWVEAKFAIYKIRCSAVNVNFRWTEGELRYIFDNSDMTALIYQAEYEPLIAAARDAQPRLKTFLRIDDGSVPSGALPDAQDYEAALAPQSSERDFPERSEDDIYLLYTGGTTGMPKGVMWRVEDVFYALGGGIDALTNTKVTSPTALADKIDPSAAQGIVTLQIAPLMHGAGQFGMMRGLFEGNTVVLIAKFDAEKVWRLITDLKINVVGFTGDAMARPLADAYEKMKDEIDLSSLFSFGSTAAIFSPSLKEYFRGILPDYTMMMDAIGSTEGGMNGFRLVQAGENPNAAEGIATVNASLDTVVLDDDLNVMEPGTGKIGKLARGGNIPLGYYKDPEKTAATFVTDAQGNRWSVPGDFARLEADGRITLLGRGNVSINSGGEKIFPEEVEGALKSHPSVYDCLVVGVPDDRWGQRVAAVVKVRDGHVPPTVAEIQEHAKGAIAGYKVPRELIFIDEIPRHANGKADYRTAQAFASEHTAGASATPS